MWWIECGTTVLILSIEGWSLCCLPLIKSCCCLSHETQRATPCQLRAQPLKGVNSFRVLSLGMLTIETFSLRAQPSYCEVFKPCGGSRAPDNLHQLSALWVSPLGHSSTNEPPDACRSSQRDAVCPNHPAELSGPWALSSSVTQLCR